MNTGNTILAILAGAALGVLFAPDKGTKTREKIKEQVNSATDNIVDKATEVKDKIKDVIDANSDHLESRIETVITEAGYKTDDIIETLEKKLAHLKSKNKSFKKS